MDDIVTRDQRRTEATRDERGAEAPARPTREEAEAAVRTLIAWAGDNPDREGLLDTPRRVVKAYEELFAGYRQDPSEHLSRVFDDVDGYKDLILIRDIPSSRIASTTSRRSSARLTSPITRASASSACRSWRASSTRSRAGCKPRKRCRPRSSTRSTARSTPAASR